MSDQYYTGTRSPEDEGSDFNADEFHIRQVMGQMWTSMPVKVMAVHPGSGTQGGTVDVMPLVNQMTGQGTPVPHGTIFGVPYGRQQAGLCAFIVEPVVGDLGECSFSSHDISSVLKNAAQSNPGSARRFSPSDAIYRGAIASINPAPTTFISIANGIITVTATTSVTVTAPQVTVVSDDVSLGDTGGPAVARVGDSVDLSSGLITSGSAKVSAA